jgi:uncharacterized membrane protein
MVSLVSAAVFFLAIHFVLSGTKLRDRVVAATGETAFQGLFSLLSLLGLVWLGVAYAHADLIPLWATTNGVRLLNLPLMAVAFLLAVVGLTTPSPTAAGGEALLETDEPARGILRVSRHPFLWGVALWAIGHLTVNGDAASLVLFGSLLVLALIGPLSIDLKRERKFGPSWRAFAAKTSSIPFGAIVDGRNTFRLGEIGWWRIGVAVGAYLVMLAVHGWVFGVSPFPH